jgi:eukaryotic-like serine/threonine-protein kinase
LSRGPEIVVTSLDTGKREVLIQGGQYPVYIPTGHLLYQQAQRLMAAPFDIDRLALAGAAVPVIDGIESTALSFAVSDTGLLVYRSGSPGPSALVWVDRKGGVTPLDAERQFYAHPRLSPDGRRIVVNVKGNLWIREVRARMMAQLTFEGGNFPVWTPDSLRVIYGRPRTTTGWDIFWKPADGSGAEQGLVTRVLDQTPAGASIASHSQLLAFKETTSDTSSDLWFRSMRDGTERVFLNGPAIEKTPTLSPDGRFVALVSNERGGDEVFIRPLTGEGLWRVSYDGGAEPVWAPTGELFYRHRDQMLVVDITTAPDLVVGTPRRLFEGPYILSEIEDRNYDVTPDGQRFLMIRAADPSEGTVRLNAVVNWFEELKRLVPTN